MKKYSYILFCFLGLTNSVLISGQKSYDWKDSRFESDYSPLYSDNKIPAEFSIPTINQCLKEMETMADSLDDLTNKQKKEFIFTTNYFEERLFRSGSLLFGDSVSLYINKIAKKVLEPYPELSKKIRFYTCKSPETNAFCTRKGAIYINVGLLARLNTEAELAFIIGHEIAHYMKNHSYRSMVDSYTMSKKSGKYDTKSIEDRLTLKFKFEKNQEFEADSIGVNIFSKAGYSVESSQRTMDLLYYDYLPFEEVAFRHDYFNSDEFIVPEIYFPDSVKVIPPVGERNERYHTHPNILRRKNKLDTIINALKVNKGASFLIDDKEFLRIRETCRFESVWLNLLGANYPDAVYDSYVLQQKYPDNKFLKIAIARGLYGISKYKNADNLHLVAKRYTSLQGESEAIHHLFKHLSKKQMNVLALRYLLDNKSFFNDNSNFISLRNDMIKEMVVVHEIKLDAFKSDSLGEIDTKNFHFIGMPEFSLDQELIDVYESYYPDLEKKKADYRISYKEKSKREKEESKEIKKNGYKINANSIILLDPYCLYVTNRKKINYFKAHTTEKMIVDYTKEVGPEIGVSIFSSSSININANFNYNLFSLLKFWMTENTIHSKVDMTPINSEKLFDQFKFAGAQYVYKVNVYTYNKNKYYSVFHSTLVDMKSGEIVYERKENGEDVYSEFEIKKLIKSDLTRINK